MLYPYTARAQEGRMRVVGINPIESDSVEWQPATRLAGRNWVSQLIASGFHINDPGINYPAFARWCVGVYNWGNRVFNSYDPEYVIGTGTNWKLHLQSDIWGRGYMMHFADRSQLQMRSEVYADIGVRLAFMAVSVGHTFNANSLIGNHYDRERWDFSFTCSRFAASFNYSQSSGGTRIMKFGSFEGGRHIHIPFNDISVRSLIAQAYYFFNNRKYAQAAAYCFSKYQLRSAGSAVLGFSYTQQRMDMDFSHLPEQMLSGLPTLQREYLFRNTDYNIIAGYAYNWVLKPKVWLLNMTVLPSVGYKHSSEHTDMPPIKTMISTNLQGMLSVVYNHRSFYASLQGHATGFVNYTNDYTFVTANGMLTFFVGVRF